MQKTAFQQRRRQNKIETIEGKTFFLLYCHSLVLYEVASTWSNLILQNLLQITGPYCAYHLRNRIWNWVAKLHRLAGRYDNPMPIWFLAPIVGLKLPTQEFLTIWNRVGIGLLYRPASLCSLFTQIQTRFLESIPNHIAELKFLTLADQCR